MDKIAVLIPCYNESATIAKVVKDYRAETTLTRRRMPVPWRMAYCATATTW